MVAPPLPMMAPIFVRIDLDRQHARRELAQFRARRGDGGQHAVEDFHPADAGLLQRLRHDIHVEATDLNVHLQGGDAVAGAGDFEVHVAQMIFQPLDVGEDGVFRAVSHQAHRHTGYRPLNGHAAVHQRQAEAQTLAWLVLPLDDSTSDTTRMV
jgi:hypothetical protein